jgi:hypothetical protein
MRPILYFLTYFLFLFPTVSYMKDVIKGKVRLVRSTRVMFFALLLAVLFQQGDLGVGASRAITIAELIISSTLLLMSIFWGMNGLKRLDMICYGIFFVDLFVWLVLDSAFWGINIFILADFVAVTPVLVKIYKSPKSETPLFYFGGVVGPICGYLLEPRLDYIVIVIPFYLSLINFIPLMMILFKKDKTKVKEI